MPISIDVLIDRMTWAARSDLTEFGFEAGGIRITLRRENQAALNSAALGSVTTSAVEEEAVRSEVEGAVESPLGGICYLASETGAAPFVRLGDQVEEGQALCLIEAMKLMTSVPAPFGGTIEKICVVDGASIEAGSILFEIRK